MITTIDAQLFITLKSHTIRTYIISLEMRYTLYKEK